MAALFDLKAPDLVASTLSIQERELLDSLSSKTGPQDESDASRLALFTGAEELFAYRRTQSRLYEMHSDLWWSPDAP